MSLSRESAATRPLCTAGLRFERYTCAIKHLSPPALFESRPSYRLLGASLAALSGDVTLLRLVASRLPGFFS